MRFPRIAHLRTDCEGEGYFLCARKERRVTRNGEPWLFLLLQDVSGEIPGKIFGADRERLDGEFDAGEFVLVRGRTGTFNGRPELNVSSIRRVFPEQDRANGFREEDCVPCAPRPIDDMWRDLEARIAQVMDAALRVLLTRLAKDHENHLRIWPAAQRIHHAYRGGLLEHILQVALIGDALAAAYGADADLVFAGALTHDIGKLRELDYDRTPGYSREGNLVGHIGLGLLMVREASAGIAGLTAERLGEIEHLVASHHGTRDRGALVAPKTVEAVILATADELDATLHQIRRHLSDDDSEGEFTAYHARLERSFLKPRAT